MGPRDWQETARKSGQRTNQDVVGRWLFGQLLDRIEIPDFVVGFAFSRVEAVLYVTCCRRSLDGGSKLR